MFTSLVAFTALIAQGASPTVPFGFLLNASFSDPYNQGGMANLGVINFDNAGNVSRPVHPQGPGNSP